MRFISTQCIREGMILEESIYNSTGGLLLRKGIKINKNYKKKINNIGLSGIYINDELSKDIEIENIVNVKIRNEAINGIKTMFNHISKGEDVENSLKDIIEIMNNIIDDILKNEVLMVNMVDIKVFDDYTFSHSVNVAVLSLIMGVSLGLDEKEVYDLGIGALLHDIGKVFISDEVLNKKGELTDQEMKYMKEHSAFGYEFLKDNKLISNESLTAILDHHERFDGTGYPNKTKGKEISLYGRIVAICDVYDALTSNRVYKKAMVPSEAMEYVIGSSGTHFDYDLVKVFYAKVATFPLGTIVLLSNGRKAIVIENHSESSNRPTLETLDNGEILSLMSDKLLRDITIVEVLQNM